jgi:uncharacterized protein (DUF934 family)
MGKWQAVYQGRVVAEADVLRDVLAELERLGYSRAAVTLRYKPEPGEVRV